MTNVITKCESFHIPAHKVRAQEHSLIPNLKLMTEAELNESRPLETFNK